jgi:hypothetical protein
MNRQNNSGTSDEQERECGKGDDLFHSDLLWCSAAARRRACHRRRRMNRQYGDRPCGEREGQGGESYHLLHDDLLLAFSMG